MSIETPKKLETFKGIKKKNVGIQQFFIQLKFNKKRPKYDYNSGLVAGMLVDKLSIAKPIIESKDKINEDIAKKMFESIIPMAKTLVESYNWNLPDLTNLAEQFFGDEE